MIVEQKTIDIGVDEAGRGAAVGPLVIAAVLVTPENALTLSLAGVQDSKAFSKGEKGRVKREELFTLIRKTCVNSIQILPYNMISAGAGMGLLNKLERRYGAVATVRILEQTQITPHNIIGDGASIFGREEGQEWLEIIRRVIRTSNLSSFSTPRNKTDDEIAAELLRLDQIKVTGEDKADSKYLAVAAASILAKHRRDAWITNIFGYMPRGGGYPNSHTAELLMHKPTEDLESKYELRKSWAWTKKFLEERKEKVNGKEKK